MSVWRRYPRMTEQLCWSCAKACGGCSWSRKTKPEPVPGWTAEPRTIKMASITLVPSYAITDCPEYVQDCEDSSKPRRRQALTVLLYNAGKNDGEISRALGIPKNTVRNWRHRTGRKANAGSGKPKEAT